MSISFSLSKSEKYYYDHESVMEMNGRGRRNRRTVWDICTQPFSGIPFCDLPPELVDPCILAGSRAGDYVLDPFFGSGTVGIVCQKRGRKYIGVELHPDYFDMAVRRLSEREKQLDLLEIAK